MLFSISLIASIVVLMILVLLPKKMHRFEYIFNAMVFNYLYTYQFSVFTNLKWVTLSSDMEKVIPSIIIRFIMYPVLTLLFLQIYLTLRSLYAKLPLMFSFPILLGLIQYVMKWSGIIEQFGAIAMWATSIFIILLLCIWAMNWFRSMIGKELLLP
jgi:hypothetical protein